MASWIRKLARNGHGNTVNIPAQLLDHLRLRGGDQLLVTLTERDTIEIRRPTPDDLRTAFLSPVPVEPLEGARR